MPHGRTTNAQHRRGCGIRKFHMYIHSRNIQASQAFIPSHTVYFTVLGTIHTHLAFCFAFVHITCLHLFCVHGPPLTQIAPHASLLPLPPSFLTAASSFPRSHPPSERVSSVPVALQHNFHCLCLFFHPRLIFA